MTTKWALSCQERLCGCAPGRIRTRTLQNVQCVFLALEVGYFTTLSGAQFLKCQTAKHSVDSKFEGSDLALIWGNTLALECRTWVKSWKASWQLRVSAEKRLSLAPCQRPVYSFNNTKTRQVPGVCRDLATRDVVIVARVTLGGCPQLPQPSWVQSVSSRQRICINTILLTFVSKTVQHSSNSAFQHDECSD